MLSYIFHCLVFVFWHDTIKIKIEMEIKAEFVKVNNKMAMSNFNFYSVTLQR